MRRGTLIAITVLLLMLVAATAWQIKIASEPHSPYPGPVSPGAIP